MCGEDQAGWRGRAAAENRDVLEEKAAGRAGASGGINNQILLLSGAVYQREESSEFAFLKFGIKKWI